MGSQNQYECVISKSVITLLVLDKRERNNPSTYVDNSSKTLFLISTEKFRWLQWDLNP